MELPQCFYDFKLLGYEQANIYMYMQGARDTMWSFKLSFLINYLKKIINFGCCLKFFNFFFVKDIQAQAHACSKYKFFYALYSVLLIVVQDALTRC